MFECAIGEDAMIEMESSDITGASMRYAGTEYVCTAIVEGMGDALRNGLSPVAETTVYVRKSVLPERTVFGVGNLISITRNFNKAVSNHKIADQLSIRDLVFAWELTLVSSKQKA